MTDEYDPLASVQAAGPPGTVSFIYGLPDPKIFPAEDLRRAMDGVLREQPALALQYGPEQGYGPLIDYLRGRLRRGEDLALDRAQIMLTGGSSQILDHLCTLFTRPGDVVLVEAPTYHESLQLFRDHGLKPVQIPMDQDGLQLEALSARLQTLTRHNARIGFLYIIPNFQNPSGISLATERRHHLLELAERFELLIVEDDVYHDLAYEGKAAPSVFALDTGHHVLRIGSFSKILAPALRMGWLMAPPERIDRLINSGLRCMGGGANPLVANILAAYCQRGLLEPHIAHLRQVYRHKRDGMLAALEAYMPAGARWTHPGGGFFVWLTLPEPLRAVDIVDQAGEAGVLLLPGDPFFAETPTGQHLRLAFSYVTEDQIEEGVKVLGRVLASAR